MNKSTHAMLVLLLAMTIGWATTGRAGVTGPMPDEAIPAAVTRGGEVGRGLTPYTTFAGDPINLVTGNMYHTERDIHIPGRGGLDFVFERSYNSRLPETGPLGYGWTHSFNHYLSFHGVEDGLAKVSRVDGSGNEKFFATDSPPPTSPVRSPFS